MAYVFNAFCNSDRNYFDADGEGGRYDDMTTFAKMSAGGAGIHTIRYTTYHVEHTVQSAIRHVQFTAQHSEHFSVLVTCSDVC